MYYVGVCVCVWKYVVLYCIVREFCAMLGYGGAVRAVVYLCIFIGACIFVYVCLYVVELWVRVCVISQSSHIGISYSLLQLISILGGYFITSVDFYM